MYEQEQEFFQSIVAGNMERTDRWVDGVSCPVIYLDGTKTISENINYLMEICWKASHA